MLVEIELQVFIGVVDAQLFKAILLYDSITQHLIQNVCVHVKLRGMYITGKSSKPNISRMLMDRARSPLLIIELTRLTSHPNSELVFISNNLITTKRDLSVTFNFND